MIPTFTRRQMLRTIGAGFGALGLAGTLAQEALADANPLSPKSPHFPPRAKRVIFLFMNGGPSHVDTFDPKPDLAKHHGEKPPEGLGKGRQAGRVLMGSPFKFEKRGKSGIEVSELYPELSTCIDDLCVIRSMATDVPNHEPALLMMNSGQVQPTRPSLGSWLTYGLGTENQNLPGFVVVCPGKPVVGPRSGRTASCRGSTRGRTSTTRGSTPRTSSPT